MSILDGTIKEIHEAYVAKETTPFKVVQEAIARLKANDDNAVETLMEEQALDLARNLGEVEAGNYFWGIPFAIKDNFSTKDVLTTASSDILNDYVPVYDATVVRKLLDAKAIPICKTTLDELAMGGTGTTGHKGTTFNPYDRTHTLMVGGSSCGSAAVVADAITPFALGSDTGDSVRKPAAYSGLVGFKPTWGRISRFGLFPFAPSLDHVAYFTRSVEDSAIALRLLAGFDESDATSANKEVPDYLDGIEAGVKGKKIAVIKEIIDSIENKAVIQAFDKSLERLRKNGAIINHVSMDHKTLESLYPTYLVISCAEATSNNANLDGINFGIREQGASYQEIMAKTRTKGFSELIKRRFIIGSFALMRENQKDLFLRAQKNRHKVVDMINGILKENDAIYLPSAPGSAPAFDAAGDRLSDTYLIADNHLCLGNFAGLPSISIPLGLEKGMPFGGNIMGRAFEEAAVLRIARDIEKSTGLYNLSARKVIS